MDNISNLTKAESEIANISEFDLGVGYPEITNPKWIEDIWRYSSLDELLAKLNRTHDKIIIPETISLPRTSSLHAALVEACLHFLQISSDYKNYSRVTYSGSHALERVFAATINSVSRVLITSPCIDIIPVMILEKNPNCVYYFSASGGKFWDLCAEQLCVEIRNTKPTDVVLTSPDNPTGHTFTPDELHSIALACLEVNATLVCDHCFANVGRNGSQAPLISDNVADGLKWAMVWDTGKLFDLDDEKIGLIITSKNLDQKFNEKLQVLQCTLPKRLLVLMTVVLNECIKNDYTNFLARLINRSYSYISDALEETSLQVLRPDSGSLLLIDLENHRLNSADFSKYLLEEHNVGVVSGSAFFLASDQEMLRNRYVRIALARDFIVFSKAIDKLREFSLHSDAGRATGK